MLASGIYGIVKVVATSLFVFFFVETLGRKASLFISALGMGTLFFIVGAIDRTHPPPVPAPGTTPNPPVASKAMAAMLYIYVCFYSMGWGPLPWVYVSDIFPTRTRHYGLALASASQWLFSVYFSIPMLLSSLHLYVLARLCGSQGHTFTGDRSRLQTILYVWHHQHRWNGSLLLVSLRQLYSPPSSLP